MLTFYFSTIIEYMVCLHPNVAALLSTTIPSVAAIGGAVESPPKPIGITDLPERAALLEAMCTFFAKLPRDTSATLVHQHLRIFKHVLAGSRQPDVPQCLIELVERGSLGEKLEFFHASHEEILLDCIQMLSLMTSDRRLALALVKHAGASSEYSMLNVLNRILSMRLALKAPHEKVYFGLARNHLHTPPLPHDRWPPPGPHSVVHLLNHRRLTTSTKHWSSCLMTLYPSVSCQPAWPLSRPSYG